MISNKLKEDIISKYQGKYLIFKKLVRCGKCKEIYFNDVENRIIIKNKDDKHNLSFDLVYYIDYELDLMQKDITVFDDEESYNLFIALSEEN